MRYPTKIAIAIRDDLATWQRLNVTAFLASGVAAGHPHAIGEPYRDASGTTYLALFREPVLVYAADAAALTQVHTRALARGLAVAVYTDEMFVTSNDADNRAAVEAVSVDKLRFAGLALYGPRTDVDKAVKGLSLHP
jgi:hypothetical protein